MNIASLAPIATIGGAIIGSFLGFLWQMKSEKRKMKINVFQTLMAYRGVGAIEPDWIKCLNIIDVVFYGNKKIKTLRKDYFTHLYEPLYSTRQHEKILLDLLFEIAKDIGYKSLTQSDILDYYGPKLLRTIYNLPNDRDELPPTAPGNATPE